VSAMQPRSRKIHPSFPIRAGIPAPSRVSSVFAGAALLAAALCLAGSAQAKTCTVDLDEVRLLRKEILELVKTNAHIDADRAAAVKRKYGDALKGGTVTVDPNDFKGIVSLKGKPSPAVVQDLLTRLQNIIASCE
jgi:hypothetical protein